MNAKKKTTSRSPAKKAAKKATGKKATTTRAAKATKKTTAKATPATKKTAAKATKKTTAKTASAAKKATGSPAKRPATKKTAAPAASTKAAGRTRAKKATAKTDVAKSTTTTATDDGATPVIPPEFDYLHDKVWLEGQREALLRERASYTSSADRLAAEAAALMADREPGDVQFDEESGEGDTIAVERDRDLALSAAARQSVSEIDAALARLDNNTYGVCIAGNDIIPRERLEAIPEASVCVAHKTSMF